MSEHTFTVKVTLKAPVRIKADTKEEALKKFEALWGRLLIDDE
jgi:hypothetical protein